MAELSDTFHVIVETKTSIVGVSKKDYHRTCHDVLFEGLATRNKCSVCPYDGGVSGCITCAFAATKRQYSEI